MLRPVYRHGLALQTRRLLAEVEVQDVLWHPSAPRDLVVVKVLDPDFPSGPQELTVVSEPLWRKGDRALLLRLGCRVPKNLKRFQGLFKELLGAALARCQGAMEGPIDVKGVASHGLLLPFSEQGLEKADDLEALEAASRAFPLSRAYNKPYIYIYIYIYYLGVENAAAVGD